MECTIQLHQHTMCLRMSLELSIKEIYSENSLYSSIRSELHIYVTSDPWLTKNYIIKPFLAGQSGTHFSQCICTWEYEKGILPSFSFSVNQMFLNHWMLPNFSQLCQDPPMDLHKIRLENAEIAEREYFYSNHLG